MTDPYKVAAFLPISTQMLEDVAGMPSIDQLLAADLDRYVRPWAYPDRVRWPHFDPFPRWSKFVNRLKRMRVFRGL